MAQGPYKSINLPDELVELIDGFVEENEWGYRNRAEVAASAIRAFLMEHGVVTRSQLREMRAQRQQAAERAEDLKD